MARTTRDESEKTLVAIIDATVVEIAEHGYAGLRIPAVAKRIGKTQGAVYGRFANKEQLAIAAVRYLRDAIVMPKISAALAEADTTLAKLESMSGALAQVAAEYPHGQLMFTRLAVEMAAAQGPLADETRSLFSTFGELMTLTLEQGRESGELWPEIEPRQLAYVFIGLPLTFCTLGTMYSDQLSYGQLEGTLRPLLSRGIAAAEPAAAGKDEGA